MHIHSSPVPKANAPLTRNSQIIKGYAKLLKTCIFSCREVIYSVSVKCLAAKQRPEFSVLFKYLHKSAGKLEDNFDTIFMESALFI